MYSDAGKHGETFLQYRAAEYAGHCQALTRFPISDRGLRIADCGASGGEDLAEKLENRNSKSETNSNDAMPEMIETRSAIEE